MDSEKINSTTPTVLRAVRTTRRRPWQRLFYKLCGPTTRALRLEGFIWLTMMLLVVAHLQSLYRRDAWLRNHTWFLLSTALWLAKYLLVRWIVCWDASTTHAPTTRGLLHHSWTNYGLGGGTIYDRPHARQLAKFLGLKEETAPLLQSSQATLAAYAVPWCRRGRVGRTLRQWWRYYGGKFTSIVAKSSSNQSTTGTIPRPAWQQRSHFGLALAHYQRQQWDTWRHYLPSVQFLLVAGSVWILKNTVRRWIFPPTHPSAPTYLYMASLGVALHQEPAESRQGAYQPRSTPPHWWSDVWSVPVVCFVGLYLWWWARVGPVLPDVVAGRSPLADLRADKDKGSKASSSSSSSPHQNHNAAGWSKLEAFGLVSPTTHAWSEAQAPLAPGPRWHVYAGVTSIRLLDMLWVVLWLPRLKAVCRLTGQCTSSPWQAAERAAILYPAAGRGTAATLPIQNVMNDWTFLLLECNVGILAIVLLCTQTVLSNRTYWASWGQCAKEWELLEMHEATTHPELPAWDSRKKYQTGDKVVYHDRIFQATLDHPEGRPYYGVSRRLQSLLSQEMGDPSTSTILAKLAVAQMCFFLGMFLLWFYTHANGLPNDGILCMVLANAVVLYVLSVEGRVTPSTLAHLNEEPTES